MVRVYPNGSKTFISVSILGVTVEFSSLAILDCFKPVICASCFCVIPFFSLASISFTIKSDSKSILAFRSGLIKSGSFHKSLNFVPNYFQLLSSNYILYSGVSFQVVYHVSFSLFYFSFGRLLRFLQDMMH